VDALLLETFDSLMHIEVILGVLGDLSERPPAIVQMTFHQRYPEPGWHHDPVAFVQAVAAMGAEVVGINCLPPWDAQSIIEKVHAIPEAKSGQVLLSAMPNAGGFQRIGRRYMTRVNPEYMGRLAPTFAGFGVRLIGGCCEVHPEHVREMNSYLHSSQPRWNRGSEQQSAVSGQQAAPIQPLGHHAGSSTVGSRPDVLVPLPRETFALPREERILDEPLQIDVMFGRIFSPGIRRQACFEAGA